ncbi:hypothetical protein J2T22_003014 [Pseudarthrobacter defluvii]|uniref:Uncharacterized protein n=1 Tax=Pseudarthrobacter defluvii TaxID=410837 RepID=A0ABT9UN47_9MICC|nr:hypothetical protein [Pseudarthrobacter defluvii]
MGFDPNEPEQRRRLRAAMKAADISISALWLKYFGLSGDAGEYEVEAYLQGLLSLPASQRDLLALAANELIEDLPRPRAPYSDDFSRQPGGSPAGRSDTGLPSNTGLSSNTGQSSDIEQSSDTGQAEDASGRGDGNGRSFLPDAEHDSDGGAGPGTTTPGP